jgi:hypothetical protein
MNVIDRLFLSQGCPDCAVVKGELNFSFVSDDRANKENRQLLVFSSASDDSARDLLNRYGLSDKQTPVYLTDEGKAIDDVMEIISEIRGNGFSRGVSDD